MLATLTNGCYAVAYGDKLATNDDLASYGTFETLNGCNKIYKLQLL